MIGEYNLDCDANKLAQIVKGCTKTLGDFFLIDLETNDPNLKYRDGFKGIPLEAITGEEQD